MTKKLNKKEKNNKRKKIAWFTFGFTLLLIPAIVTPLVLLNGGNKSNSLLPSNESTTSEIVINKQPTDLRIPQGLEASFQVEIKLNTFEQYKSLVSFQWYETSSLTSESGKMLSNETSNILSIPTQSNLPNTNKFFYCLIKFRNYIIRTKTVVLNIVASPGAIVIEKQPTSQLAISGDKINFDVSSSVPNPIYGNSFSYQWYETDKDNLVKKLLVNETQKTLSIQTDDSFLNLKKYFYCEIGYKDSKTVTTNIATLYTFLNSTKPIIKIDSQPLNKVIYLNQSVFFDIGASITNPLAGEPIGYQWYETNQANDVSSQVIIDGSKNPSALTSSLIIDGVNNNVATTKYYICKVYYATLTQESNVASLLVNPLNDITIIGQPQSVTSGSIKDWYFTIKAQPNVVIPGGNLKYQWYKDDVAIVGANDYYIHVLDSSNYYCEVSYAFSNPIKSNVVKISSGLSTEVIDILTQPQNLNLPINSDATFSFTSRAKTSGFIPFPSGFSIYYQWFETTSNQVDSNGVPLTTGQPIASELTNYVGGSSRTPIVLAIPATENTTASTKYYYCMLTTSNGSKVYYTNIVSLVLN